MPTIAIEIPRCLNCVFPVEPVRIGPLVLMRQSLSDEIRTHAEITDALTRVITARTGSLPVEPIPTVRTDE